MEIENILCFVVFVLSSVLSYCSFAPIGSSHQLTNRKLSSYKYIEPFFAVTKARELFPTAKILSLPPSGSINDEAVNEHLRMEDNNNILSGESRESPDPEEVEEHRAIQVGIIDQHEKSDQNGRSNSTIKEKKISTANKSKPKDINSNSSADEGKSPNDLAETIIQEIPEAILEDFKKLVVKLAQSKLSSKKSYLERAKSNSPLSLSSETSKHLIKNSSNENSYGVESQNQNKTFSKQYSKLPKALTPSHHNLSNILQRPDNKVPLGLKPQQQRIVRQTDSVKPGSMHVIPISTGSMESLTDSPLTITDQSGFHGDVTQTLIDFLMQSNQGGSLAGYNDILERALEALANQQQSSNPSDILFVNKVNHNGPSTVTKPPIGISFSGGFENADGVSPEVLANLLIRLQLPSNEELKRLSDQITTLSNMIFENNTLEAVNTTSVTTLLTTLSTAVISIITEVITLAAVNPLISALCVLALCVLIIYIHKNKYGKKSYHHGGGYGHHSSGYHRKSDYDYDEYEMFDADTQIDVAADILGKIDNFDSWLRSDEGID